VGVWAISLLVAAELLCLLRCATILGTTPRLLGTTLGSAPLRAPLVALVDRGLVAKLRKACCMFASGDVAAAGKRLPLRGTKHRNSIIRGGPNQGETTALRVLGCGGPGDIPGPFA